MAKISVIKDCIRICRDAGITPFIWGHRGLGKSSLVSQIAGENGWGFLDLRCSQLEASDIRGLPDARDGKTVYLPPADMPIGDLNTEQVTEKLAKLLGIKPESKNIPDQIAEKLDNASKRGSPADMELERKYYAALQLMQPRFQNGILFLDEVNRAADDVLQAAFQLVLDRKVGQYVLPPGWCVVSAGNFMEGYQVSGFNDAAFLDRFCHVTLSDGETTLEEWIDYMAQVHGGDASSVIEFASQNTTHLDGDMKGELGFKVMPSRRSWESIVKVDKACSVTQYPDVARETVLGGLIGIELARSYSRYSCPVKPRDLLKQGVKSFRKKLEKLSRNEMTGLMWGLVSFCKNKTDDDAIAEVCLDFAEFMCDVAKDKDVVVAFCRALVSGGDANSHQEKARAAVISNPKLAQMINKFNTRSGKNRKKSFIDRLVERPPLQKALSRVSWGSTDED